MSKSIFIILFTLGTLTVSGQNGYIITTSGDSISGKISLLLPSKFHEEVQIKTENDKQRFKAYKVTHMMIDEEAYHTVKLENIYKFMLLQTKGYASLYKYRSEQSFEFNGLYLLKKDGTGIDVPNFNFKKLIGNFVSDCEEVAVKVNDRTYRKSNIDELLEAYNACISSGEVYKYATLQKIAANSDEITLVVEIMDRAKAIDPESELVTLLTDIKSKIEKGETVPKYLKSALKEQTADIDDVKDKVSELLKKLSK